MTTPPKVGFVGAGNMAGALVRGMVAAGDTQPDQPTSPAGIGVTDIDGTRSKALAQAHGVKQLGDATALVQWADVIVLAVKPQVIPGVLTDLATDLGERHLLISIAGGVTTAQLAEPLAGRDVRLVRAMPNTPSLVGEGATAVCGGPGATEEDLATARALFSSVGRVVTVQESSMNAVTGLSGSGPAYVFMAIEALSDAGVREGLTREIATELAAQTVLGAAKLVLETGEHPGRLKDQVTSPAGTTMEGVATLEREGLRSALQSGVRAAVQRADELGKR